MKYIFTLILLPTLLIAATPKPEMKSILDEMSKKEGKPIEALTVDQARQRPSPQSIAEAVGRERGTLDVISSIEISDIKIDGASNKIPARLYRPEGKLKLPVVIYYHGGGWVLGKSEDYDATIKSLSAKTGAIYLLPEYRKGPEHKFPAAHDDAYAAYLWVIKNAKEFGGDPERVAVAGESAGGNLAMNVSIRARDEKVQMPIYELLIYPVAGTNTQTESYKLNKDSKPLNSQVMGWFMNNYLRAPEDFKDKRINLIEADLSGLPPTTIITAEIDPLRSEGQILASRLKKQGVVVVYKDYPGMTHEFFSMAPVLNEAKQAQEEVANDIKDSFIQMK